MKERNHNIVDFYETMRGRMVLSQEFQRKLQDSFNPELEKLSDAEKAIFEEIIHELDSEGIM